MEVKRPLGIAHSLGNKKDPLGVLFVVVGLPGIEPGLYAPEAHVLPVYYSPSGGGNG